MTVAPGLAAAPQAAYEIVQPRSLDDSYTDSLPLVSPKCDTLEGSPPAEINISRSPDSQQTEISMTSTEMAGGSPPVDIDIFVAPDTLQTEVSVMTVMSEKWMERFVINPQVLCSDGLAPDDDPARRSSDVGSDAGVIQDPIPKAVSVRTLVSEEWMDRFVLEMVECPSVSRTSAVGPAVSEEYSPVVFTGGGGGADAYPLVVVESDTAQVSVPQSFKSDTARVSVLPVAGCKFPAVFWGRSPWMWLAWALARRISEWTRRKPC